VEKKTLVITPEERQFNEQRAKGVRDRIESERANIEVARQWKETKAVIDDQTQQLVVKTERGQAASARSMRATRFKG
jgi:hypothetical protein